MTKVKKINKDAAGAVIRDLSLAYIFSLYRNQLIAEDEYLNLKDDIFDALNYGVWDDLLVFADNLIANINSMKDSINEGIND